MKPQWIEVRYADEDAPLVLFNLAYVWAIDCCSDGTAALNLLEDHTFRITASYEQIRNALPNVVSSAPQSTMEGVFAMGDPEKTDLAVEIANLVGRAIEQGADVEEVKAVLNEVLDELEAQDNGDNDNGEPKEDGENA